MKTVSFFDLATGLFTGNTFSSTNLDAIQRQVPPCHGVVDGKHDHLSRRVDLGKVTALHEGHVPAHAARAAALRDGFTPGLGGGTFQAPELPLLIADASVVIDLSRHLRSHNTGRCGNSVWTRSTLRRAAVCG